MIYLDNAATTPVHPRVVAAMLPPLTESYGNPSSRHAVGLAAERVVRSARREVAERVAVDESQVLFTSGATEANALAVLGTARKRRRPGHVLVSAIEHPSVLSTAQLLERSGHRVERVPVCAGGWVEPERLAALVRDDTFLVALMHVNNETGVVQPVQEIGALLRRTSDARLLVDAVQSFGRLPIDMRGLGADLLTLSAHKIGGPKGVGCLVRSARADLAPLWGGGEQEGGLRPGTENVPGVAGLAAAVRLHAELPGDAADGDSGAPLEQAARRRRPGAYALGDPERRVAQILSLAIPGVKSEILTNLLEARGVCASSGSACHSRRSLRSHVLEAMGVPPEHGVVRFSFGLQTSAEDLARAAAALDDCLGEL